MLIFMIHNGLFMYKTDDDFLVLRNIFNQYKLYSHMYVYMLIFMNHKGVFMNKTDDYFLVLRKIIL